MALLQAPQSTGTSGVNAEFVGCTTTALADFMPVGYLAQNQLALNAWSAVANLSFTQVADDGAAMGAATASGDLPFGGHTFDGAFGVLAHGFYPPFNAGNAAGDMHFDMTEAWRTIFARAGVVDIFQVTPHELGQTLGLVHTAVPNSWMNPLYTEAFFGPQADDIAGMQPIFGVAVAIPEPGSWAMMGLGLGVVLMRRCPCRRCVHAPMHIPRRLVLGSALGVSLLPTQASAMPAELSDTELVPRSSHIVMGVWQGQALLALPGLGKHTQVGVVAISEDLKGAPGETVAWVAVPGTGRVPAATSIVKRASKVCGCCARTRAGTRACTWPTHRSVMCLRSAARTALPRFDGPSASIT